MESCQRRWLETWIKWRQVTRGRQIGKYISQKMWGIDSKIPVTGSFNSISFGACCISIPQNHPRVLKKKFARFSHLYESLRSSSECTIKRHAWSPSDTLCPCKTECVAVKQRACTHCSFCVLSNLRNRYSTYNFSNPTMISGTRIFRKTSPNNKKAGVFAPSRGCVAIANAMAKLSFSIILSAVHWLSRLSKRTRSFSAHTRDLGQSECLLCRPIRTLWSSLREAKFNHLVMISWNMHRPFWSFTHTSNTVQELHPACWKYFLFNEYPVCYLFDKSKNGLKNLRTSMEINEWVEYSLRWPLRNSCFFIMLSWLWWKLDIQNF